MTLSNKRNWVHFIGIAGAAIGQFAVEMKDRGWIVTGSDRGLFPPMSTHLEKNGIGIELNYKPRHLNSAYYKEKYGGFWNEVTLEHPDLIIAQGNKGIKNKEHIYAQNLNIPIEYFTDLVKEEIIVEGSSIVVAGTYGKTTTTSMLAWIFEDNNINISFTFGGISNDFHNGTRFKNADTKYSVIEGDEYIISTEDRRSKFFEYSPNHVILTAVQWDHTDVFPTKDDYLNNFQKFLNLLGEESIIVFNSKDPNVVKLVQNVNCKKIPYGFEGGKLFDLQVIGSYNQENALAAYTMAKELGLEDEQIRSSLSKYQGIKRRLEIKLINDEVVIIDDFGASPSKAKSAIESIKDEFSDRQLTVIFEPNLGSRTAESIVEYAEVFSNADKIFFPRFTHVQGDYLTNDQMAEKLGFNNNQAISNDEELIKQIQSSHQKGGVIAFLGSHGFRGMIEKTVELFQHE